MTRTREGQPRRERGSIDELPSGALRVRVYAGIDPVSKRRHHLTEVARLGYRLGLDLSDPLSGDPVDVADFIERARLTVGKPNFDRTMLATRSGSVADTGWCCWSLNPFGT